MYIIFKFRRVQAGNATDSSISRAVGSICRVLPEFFFVNLIFLRAGAQGRSVLFKQRLWKIPHFGGVGNEKVKERFF